jgi:SEC-C motif domain protein
MAVSADSFCPCGSKQKYKRCCRVYHLGAKPPTALATMKARYSAYAAGNFNFIAQTTHPESKQFSKNLALWKSEIETFCQNTEFNELKIIKFEDSSETAYVTFKAVLFQNLKDASLVERSRFKKLNDRWLYLDGQIGDSL